MAGQFPRSQIAEKPSPTQADGQDVEREGLTGGAGAAGKWRSGPPPQAPAAAPPARGAGVRFYLEMDILFVENSEESRVLFSRLLTGGGHRVVPAASMEEALGLLSCLRFDALVSDLSLPDGSGLELVAEAKKRQSLRKAVALAGEGKPDEREQGLRAGFDACLAQPVDFYHLRALLD